MTAHPTIMEAHRILIGGEVINSAYTPRDWLQAAQCAMDGDTADLEYMMDRDDAREYCDRVARFNHHYTDGDWSVGDWLDATGRSLDSYIPARGASL